MQAIRHVVTAKIQYYLHLSDHGLEETRKINRLVRKYVKKILPLPKWSSNTWVHHRDVTTDFVISTVSSRSTTSNKMKMSQDKNLSIYWSYTSTNQYGKNRNTRASEHR